MAKRNPQDRQQGERVRQQIQRDLSQFARELRSLPLWQQGMRVSAIGVEAIARQGQQVWERHLRQVYRPSRYVFLRLARKFARPSGKALEIRQLHLALMVDARWSLNFIVLTVCSCAIATFGLLTNSAATIIGAMLIAPLMLPLRALAFGALEGDIVLFRRALGAILGGTATGLLLSWLMGSVANVPEFGSEVLGRTQPTLVDLGIAVVAGGIGAFAKVRREISDALAGTAISVALMPPLCVVGLGLSQQGFGSSMGAFLLYSTNLLGITLACMVVFIVAGYARISHVLSWTLALTTVLVAPLGASFVRLVQQAQLEQEVAIRLRETITVGENVEGTEIDVDWSVQPPVVSVLLQTEKEVAPNQVRLVEQFIYQRLGREFRLIFFVSQLKRVTAEESAEIGSRDERDRATSLASPGKVPRYR